MKKMTPNEVIEVLGISKTTLSRLRTNGKIKYNQINGKVIEYDKKNVYEILYNTKRKNIIYCCGKDKKETLLKRNEIENFCLNNDINFDEELFDVSLNEAKKLCKEERPKINKLIDMVLKGEVENIIILNKDNFLQGNDYFDVFSKIFYKFGTEFIIVDR